MLSAVLRKNVNAVCRVRRFHGAITPFLQELSFAFCERHWKTCFFPSDKANGRHQRTAKISKHSQLPFMLGALPAPSDSIKQVSDIVIAHDRTVEFAGLDSKELVHEPKHIKAEPSEFRSQEIARSLRFAFSTNMLATGLFGCYPDRPNYRSNRPNGLHPSSPIGALCRRPANKRCHQHASEKSHCKQADSPELQHA